ncbi:MAG: hypothetical protein AB1512_13095 [Thermodesulfobacteriota bacterium]
MDTLTEVIAAADAKKKKSLAKMILNFLLYGGWILVVGLGLAVAIVLDMYVF